MTNPHRESKGPEFEALFAAERELSSESGELRNRVIQRARETVQRESAGQILPYLPTPRKVGIGVTVAAAVFLPALCAAAFFAGYQARSGGAAVPAKLLTAAPSVVLPQAPAPSIIVALIPVEPSTHPLARYPVAQHPGLRPTASKPTGSIRTTDVEAYSMELQVLQPARLAVARQDFTSALNTIAEHQRQFPSGRLAEEREALRVKALLGLGRLAEARRAGAAFHTHFPRSVMLGRIDEMLGRQ